jgi:hypothetical protein
LFVWCHVNKNKCYPDLGTGGENVKRIRMCTFLRPHATGKATTELHTVTVERGMSWEDATDKWSELTGKDEGFYLSHQVIFMSSLPYLFLI